MKREDDLLNIEITNRFFEAVDLLIAHKVISGLRYFAELHGINRANLVTTKTNPQTKLLRVSYVSYLCDDFKINPSWLLSGKGDLFVKGYTFEKVKKLHPNRKYNTEKSQKYENQAVKR